MSDNTQRGMQEFSYFEIVQRHDLDAQPDKVFAALVGDLSPWWGAPYLLDAAARRVVLEPRPGGRLYEEWSDLPKQCEQEGAIWGTVFEIADAELIILQGAMGMPWPTQCQVRFDIEARGDGTSLKLTHRAWGRASSRTRDSYEAGWEDLLDRRLRAWVERGERLGIDSEQLPWASLRHEHHDQFPEAQGGDG
jgi:uncharacterized protein YndB with AHSA1/START domain